MGISTHVLDTARGCPAAGVPLQLSRRASDGRWEALGAGETNGDGRFGGLLPEGTELIAGLYRLHFDVGVYHEGLGVEGFYPWAEIAFHIAAPDQHYHVPLLLSPFGYSTYRGS